MNDCYRCSNYLECHYPFRPADCDNMQHFWTKEQRAKYECERAAKMAALKPFDYEKRYAIKRGK